ncbi:hypothetical protein ES703_35392 [subsurface metagenome]
MGKDDNTLLLVGGGLLAAYLFMPEKVKDAVGGAFPSIGFDLSGLLAGLNLGGGFLGGAGAAADALKDEAENIVNTVTEYYIPEGWMPIPPDWGADTSETDQPQEEGGIIANIREKTATPAAVTTSAIAAYFSRGAPKVVEKGGTKIVTAIAPRIAGTTAAKVGLRFIPLVGWLYGLADLGVTAYELVSGKGILGGWLGWGEMLGVTEQAGAMGDIIPQPTGTVSGTKQASVALTPGATTLPGFGGIAPAETMVGEGLPIPSLSPATIAALGGVPV